MTEIAMPAGNVLSLVHFRDPILHRKTERFDFSNPPMDSVQLFSDLKTTLISIGGLGLSANQVGIPYSVFVFGDSKTPDSITGVFNPKIVDGHTDFEDIEGCLSYPNVLLKIKRKRFIRVRFTTWNGGTDTRKFEYLSARVIQHETDHINGVTFGQRISKIKLSRSLDKVYKKYGNSYVVGDFYPHE